MELSLILSTVGRVGCPSRLAKVTLVEVRLRTACSERTICWRSISLYLFLYRLYRYDKTAGLARYENRYKRSPLIFHTGSPILIRASQVSLRCAMHAFSLVFVMRKLANFLPQITRAVSSNATSSTSTNAHPK